MSYNDDNYIHRHAKKEEISYKNNNTKTDILEDDFWDDYNISTNGSNNVKIVKKKKRRLKVWVLLSFLIISLFILLISGSKLLFWKKDKDNNNKIIDELKDNTKIDEVDDNSTELVNEDNNKESDYWYYITFPLINVDINSLKEKNSDTVGWINVNNTNINYPYVQTNNNDFYLDHSFDKSKNEAGWVFMDYRNSKNFDNKNTILYAHSRLDKTMFGSLSKTLNSKWYSNKDNHIIRLSTETENTMWQIFSVYKIKEESYYITTDFSNNNDYSNFLNTIKDRSIYNFNSNLTTDDKILTLSTCYSETERTVVHAKLIKRSSK